MPKPPRRRRFFAAREGKFHTRIAKKQPSRFDPSAEPAPTEDEASSSDGLSDVTALEESAADQEAETLEASFAGQVLLGRRPRPGKRRRLPLGFVVLLLSVCSTLAALGGYLLAKPTRRAIVLNVPRGVQENLKPVTPTEEGGLDAAYKARHQKEFARAMQLFALLAPKPWNHGAMELEIGRTLLYQGKFSDARAVLETAADKGTMAADANLLLGALYKAQKSYPQAETSFAAAVALDPTRPEYYYIWGECLREEGKLLEATTKLRSALINRGKSGRRRWCQYRD